MSKALTNCFTLANNESSIVSYSRVIVHHKYLGNAMHTVSTTTYACNTLEVTCFSSSVILTIHRT